VEKFSTSSHAQMDHFRNATAMMSARYTSAKKKTSILLQTY
jgi:hypothetical protein